jgi:CHC2 zinc finger
MRNIPNTTRSDGYGEASGEGRNSAAIAKGKLFEELIRKANTVPLTRIFSHYNVRIDNYRSNIICPFKSHKNGRESTASFYYYPDTNSFHCFGCKVGGPWAHGCEFIATMENVSRAKAASKIIQLFSSSVSSDNEISEGESFSEKLEIMMDFSNTVREFRNNHFDEKSITYIEYLCSVYDAMNLKRKLDNEALRRIVEELKLEIVSYKPCLTL